MTTRNDLHNAIKTVLEVIEYAGDLLDSVDLDDANVTWSDFESAIVVLQTVVLED